MKDIIKQLIVKRLEIHHFMEGKYQLELTDPKHWSDATSTFTLTVKDLIQFGLDPGEELVGKILELRLKPVEYNFQTYSKDTVFIKKISRTSELHHHYHYHSAEKSMQYTCRLEAKTPVSGGTLVVLPSTFYKLSLPLTEGEYRRLKSLPVGMALEVSLHLVDRNFRDIVMKYRGTLDSPRIFPDDYISRMSALARKMIDYFNGEVDVVGHYCGLELMTDKSNTNGRSRANFRTWEREYFAVDPLSPKDWEGPYAASISRIDAILKERYDNRLPMGTVHEFYDHLETSDWESKQPHAIEELSVGLEAKYVFREGHHLPSIVIEARSIAGNRKACEAACETLSQEAAKLFRVRFDHLSLSLEELRESPDKTSHESNEVTSK